MADNLIDSLRLSLMQDFLPVGIAMTKRVQAGGLKKLLEAFHSSNDPINELREEGESSAKSFRESLDKVVPGLGNPVMTVEVNVDNDSSKRSYDDDDELNQTLDRISSNLDFLDKIINENSNESNDSLLMKE